MIIEYNFIDTKKLNVWGILIKFPDGEMSDAQNYKGEMLPELIRATNSILIRSDGHVDGWSNGLVVDAYFKLRDSGIYQIMTIDEQGNILPLHEEYQDYVPDLLAFGEGGEDYLDLKIDDCGYIKDFDRHFNPKSIAKFLDMFKLKSFKDHLEWAAKEVSTWPEWKRKILQ